MGPENEKKKKKTKTQSRPHRRTKIEGLSYRREASVAVYLHGIGQVANQNKLRAHSSFFGRPERERESEIMGRGCDARRDKRLFSNPS